MKAAKILMPEGAVFICRIAAQSDCTPGAPVVVEVDYGLDAGVFEDFVEWSAERGNPPCFRVVRRLTDADAARIEANAERAAAVRERFDRLAEKVAKNIYALSVRFSYGGDRLFIRYAAPEPVNLRRLQPELQEEFRASVDLWQLGGREKAVRLGGLGVCGRPSCCCTWLKKIPNVTIRMMREQSLPVNPVSINGACGKMKCCVAFESGVCAKRCEEGDGR